MKRISILLSTILLIVACQKEIRKSNPKPTEGYHVFGNVTQCNGQTVYLQKRNYDNAYEEVKSTKVKNDQFEFSGQPEGKELMYLGFDKSDFKIPIILTDHETIVNIDPHDLEKTIVLGSTLQTDYNDYLNGYNKATNQFVYQLEYIKNNANSILAAVVLEQMLGKTKWRLGQNRKAYEQLSSEIKNTVQGKSILDFLQRNEPLVKNDKVVAELSLDKNIDNSTPVKVVEKEEKPKAVALPKRTKAINFYAESLQGGDISLDEVRKNAKVTLIDFWASWCTPCRKSNPHLKRLYQKYHSKGFEIIGVSEDKYTDKDKWKNAIQEDGLPWHQAIDDNRRIANIYKVSGIPHTVLLDQNGGIIFTKKSTYTIEQKLKEIFGF